MASPIGMSLDLADLKQFNVHAKEPTLKAVTFSFPADRRNSFWTRLSGYDQNGEHKNMHSTIIHDQLRKDTKKN